MSSPLLFGGERVEARRRVNGRFVSKDAGDPAAEGQAQRTTEQKPLQPKQCRRFAQRRIAEALPEIVDRFVREAKQGSIPHAKALAALSGLDQMEAPAEAARVRSQERRKRSLTEMLMQELKRGREACDEHGKEV